MAPTEKGEKKRYLSQSYSITQTKSIKPSNTNPFPTCTITTSFQQIYYVHIHNKKEKEKICTKISQKPI
jgi:hypothetical protein